MPNWCTNVLKVTEDIETSGNELSNFLTKAKGKSDGEEKESDFCFSALVPRPDGVDWYEWNVANWGTKWDVSADVELQDEYFDNEEGGAVVIIKFDTAWSPPIEFINKVAPMFPTLTFDLRFWEGGMGFAGRVVQKDNDIVFEESYDTADEEYWYIATEDYTDEEIEERAKENIQNNALEYWSYSMDELLDIIGKEHKEKVENLFLVKKLRGEISYSTLEEFNGGEIADIVTEFIEEQKFFEFIFNKRKEQGRLREFAI